MQPMNELELKFHLKDLERRATRQPEARVPRQGPCVLCARLRGAVRRVVGRFRAAQPPAGREAAALRQ